MISANKGTFEGVSLNLTVFLTGASVMIIEILGTRIISPFFGATVYTWTALISVSLGFLSLGYFLGGRLADKSLSTGRLYGIIALAGVSLIPVPFIHLPALKTASLLGLRMGALCAAAIFFAVPFILLGMVIPYAVKLRFKNESNLGSTVGVLYGLSTIGSLTGTLLAGFWLLPYFGNIQILFGSAGVLMLVAGVHYATHHSVRNSAVSLIIALAAAYFALFYPSLSLIHGEDSVWKTIYQANSNYGNVTVLDRLGKDSGSGHAGSAYLERLLLSDGLIQSYIDSTGLSRTIYTYALEALVSMFHSVPADVLCIGTGAGILPMKFALAGSRVDAVEINPRILIAARRYFGFAHPGISVFEQDGREFFQHSGKKYDAIILDVFQGASVPSHLLSREMFSIVSRHLKPDGMLALNILANGPHSKVSEAVFSTLSDVFPEVGGFYSGTGSLTNVYFFASRVMPDNGLSVRMVPDIFQASLQKIFNIPLYLSPKRSFIITDNYNPLEAWSAGIREQYRKASMTQEFAALADRM